MSLHTPAVADRSEYQPHDDSTDTIDTSIIIPAYNEEAGLPLVLEALKSVAISRCEVVVVDDGSTDQSVVVAERYNCRVIRHPVNRGKGAALRTGLEHARGQKIIFIDADNTYPVEFIAPMIERLNQFDLVRGTRFEGRNYIPLLNRVGNLFFDSAIQLLHSVDGGDVLSGMYGGRREALLQLKLDSDAFDIETEIMTKAKAYGFTMDTLPITYAERVGDKKLRAFHDGTRILYRVVQLAIAYNPLLTLIAPGIGLLTLGAAGLLLMLLGMGRDVLNLPLAANATYLFGTLVTLGMQIAVFGLAVYDAGRAYGLHGRRSALLERLKSLVPNRFYIGMGLILTLLGLLTVATLSLGWIREQGPFTQTPLLVSGSLCLILGVQIISSSIFISALKRLQTSQR